MTDKLAVLRTFESNKENVKKWRRKGSKKGNAKRFFNCTEMPLVNCEGVIMEKFPQPELHIFTGIFNHVGVH